MQSAQEVWDVRLSSEYFDVSVWFERSGSSVVPTHADRADCAVIDCRRRFRGNREVRAENSVHLHRAPPSRLATARDSLHSRVDGRPVATRGRRCHPCMAACTDCHCTGSRAGRVRFSSFTCEGDHGGSRLIVRAPHSGPARRLQSSNRCVAARQPFHPATQLTVSQLLLRSGGFVASAGLEAATAHSLLAEKQSVGGGNDLEGDALPAIRGPQSAQARALQAFIDDSLGSYDLLVSPVIRAMADVMSTVTASARPEVLDDCVARFVEADNRLHSQMPNHVNRRASIAQGAALLTLYAKSFSGSSMKEMSEAWQEVASKEGLHWRHRVRHRRAALIAAVKASIRSGKAPGHLAVVWGLFASALDLSRGEQADDTSCNSTSEMFLHPCRAVRGIASLPSGPRYAVFSSSTESRRSLPGAPAAPVRRGARIAADTQAAEQHQQSRSADRDGL